MRLVTMRTAEGTRAGRVEGDRVVELPWPDVRSLLDMNGWRAIAGAEHGRRRSLNDVRLAPVVPRPRKIVCLGHNYASHIKEMNRDLPSHPTLFAKYATALIGATDPIVLPPDSEQPDWEAELAVIIGQRIRNASRAQAEAAIAGFTGCNDVTMRDFQNRTMQWLQGKTWDMTCPLGPSLVTPDELGGPNPDLVVRLDVDGETMQEARTADLVFGPVDTVAYVSRILTLEPGDVLSLGTSAGVGAARQPPRYLRPGNVVTLSIEGVGQCVNECVMGGGPAAMKESRRGVRDQVALAGRVIVASGQRDMVWGHVSARDPAGPGIWMKPNGWGLEEVDAADLLLVASDGSLLAGEGRVHVEYPIHTQIYAARPEVGAVVHTHPEAAIAFAATDEPLRPISHDGAMFVPPDVPRFTDTGGLVTTTDLGQRLAAVLGDRPAALMPNHGLVAVGSDVATAVMAAIVLERACRMQLMAMAAGGVRRWSDDEESLVKRSQCWSHRQIVDGFEYLVRDLESSVQRTGGVEHRAGDGSGHSAGSC